MCSDTKEKIAEAVEQMMLTKPVSKITVQSVMEQAQMKRQTFYYHYQDIYSVLEWIVVREICTPLRYDESVSAEDWCMQALTLLRARQPLQRRISPALGREKLYQLTAGILRPQLAKNLADVFFLLRLQLAAEAQRFLANAVFDDGGQAVEGAAADEEDVGGVDLDELLMGMLAAALRGHAGHGSFQNFQKGLLYALAAHVAGDGGVFALAGDLIDFVDIDDAPLGQLNVVVRILDQPQQDVLHILAHVARFRQAGGISDGEGHLQELGQRLGQKRLAGTGGAHHQNIALLKLQLSWR